jgi:geranylgeranyl diphosphate synthase, type II
MDSAQRIERALQDTISSMGGLGNPPQLAAALRYAVFPGGARVRPRLSLAVAKACGDGFPKIADAAAASIELLHCASLVHDDLPCFDDADQRRGKPSVHRAFGEPLAVLVGDALIIGAFQTLARGAAEAPDRLVQLLVVVSSAVGAPSGIVAGQAWECEPSVSLSDYHRAKTGSLFAAATAAGALAAGAAPEEWQRLGGCLGEAFQVADDICDMTADPQQRGKPGKQDQARGRPNAVHELGLDGAGARLESLLAEASESVPACPGQHQLRLAIVFEARPFLPKGFARRAA